MQTDADRGSVASVVMPVRGQSYEVVYTWPDGTEEIRYRRPISDLSCANEVLGLRRNARMNGYESPYSVRRVRA
jgi:hypothetical protein